ncbi:MAG: helix-turn-helix domain-containing protein [Candidatus Lokiarchaeota archaeon]
MSGKNKDNINSLTWHCSKHENIDNCMEECYVRRILSLFGKKYVMPIIRELLIENKLRFNEIETKLEGSPKTITSRLRELEQFGLVHREVYNEIPIKVEYSLTEYSKDLEDIFERISILAKKVGNP